MAVVYRIHGAGQTVVGQFREGLQTGQQIVPGAFEQDLLAIEIDVGLHDLVALMHRFVHQILYRPDLAAVRNFDVVERNHVNIVQPGVLHGVAIECVFEHDLLLRHVGLGDEKGFFSGR